MKVPEGVKFSAPGSRKIFRAGQIIPEIFLNDSIKKSIESAGKKYKESFDKGEKSHSETSKELEKKAGEIKKIEEEKKNK